MFMGKANRGDMIRSTEKGPTAPLAERKVELFETLQKVGRAIRATFGDRCEVVVHDLSNLESSIVWIEGDVTGRTVGGSVTSLLLRELQQGDGRDEILGYAGYTAGKSMRSSTILFGQDGDFYAALCINFDLTDFAAAEEALRSFCRPTIDDVDENFGQDVTEILQTMIVEAAHEIGTPLPSMDKDQKVRLVGILERRGAFRIKRAVPLLASYLGVSRFTVYNYLSQVRAELETR
jgi:predicted transcriptional regulator YheO